jgi:hypothetical protein
MQKTVKKVLHSKPALPAVALYRQNRLRMVPRALAKHLGKWVAFSRDGTSIVASAKTPEKLAERITLAKKQPKDVVVEYLDAGTTVLGGAELL